MGKHLVRLYVDVDEMMDAHVVEMDEHLRQDVDEMVHFAFMMAANMLYAYHDGYVEDAIESMCAALRRAVDVMDEPQFRQPH